LRAFWSAVRVAALRSRSTFNFPQVFAMAKPNFAKDQLKSIVERVERLEEEKAALGGDIKEVYAEAKGHGFDTKIVRQVVRLRKMDTTEREERDALLDLYMSALGMAS